MNRASLWRLTTYVARFTLLYVLVYLAAGIAFMVLQDYETVLASREAFELYRSLDHPLVQAAPLLQVVRGAVLALVCSPLYRTIFGRDRGWLLLFGLLWGFTFLGSPNAIYGLLVDLSAGEVGDLLFGTAEVTVQIGLFSVLLWSWERRALARRGRAELRSSIPRA